MRFLFYDMMNIRAYTPSTPYKEGLGGTQSAICYYCEYLTLLGHQVVLLNNVTEPTTDLGVRVFPKTFLDSLDSKVETDVVVFCGGVGDIEGIAKKIDYKISIVWHGHYTFESAVQIQESQNYVADFFGFVSEFQRDRFMEMFHIPFEKTCVMMNGISPAFMKPVDMTEKELKVIYFSAPDRGLQHFQQIWPKILAKVPDAHLEVYSSRATHGLKDDEYIESMRKSLASLPNTRICASVGQKELAAHCAKSAIFAYPTHFVETSCICFFEAMAAGCIPVTSDIGVLQFQSPNCVPFELSNTFMEAFANKVAQKLVAFQTAREKTNEECLKFSNEVKTERNYYSVAKSFIHTVQRLIATKEQALQRLSVMTDNVPAGAKLYIVESVPKLFTNKYEGALFFFNLANIYSTNGSYGHFAEAYYLRSWSIAHSAPVAQALFQLYTKKNNAEKMLEWYIHCIPFGITKEMKALYANLINDEKHSLYKDALQLEAPRLVIHEPSPWDFFRNAYVIQTNNDLIRKQRTEEHLTNLGLEFKIVNTMFETQDELQTASVTVGVVSAGIVKRMSASVLQTLYNHYTLWQSELRNNTTKASYWILIMEDDVVFHPKFNQAKLLLYLENIPADANLVKFGFGYSLVYGPNVEIENDYYIKIKNNGVPGMFCYAVKSDILDILVSKQYTMSLDSLEIPGMYGCKTFADDDKFFKSPKHKSLTNIGICSQIPV